MRGTLNPVTLMRRIAKLFRRRKCARQYGSSFARSADFRLPEYITLHGIRHKLVVPDENGVKIAFIELLLDDCYRCRELVGSPEPVSTILDIGANVGLFGLAARSMFPCAELHAYEPNPFLEHYLKTQSESATFHYFMEAVGAKRGSVSLDFNADSVRTRSTVDVAGTIPQVSFHDALSRLGGDVDLVKMDCEGAEWDIFRDNDSWRRVRHLSMEYHLWPDHTHQDILTVIRSLGFRIRSHDPADTCGLLSASRP
jgi:FkbM family methyltransferase